MERLGNTRPSGIHSGQLRTWGMLFAAAGIISRGVLQNRVLGVGLHSLTELMDMMQSSENAMLIATIALVLQAMETVAVPIFVFLLAEGFRHTSDWKKYLLRVAGLALVTEIPFDWVINGKVLEFGVQNPVFGMALGIVLLYFMERFKSKKLICVIMVLAGLVWALMLRIDHGIPMVLMLCVIRIFRKKPLYMGFSGMAAAALCTGISIFYMAAPMGFLVTHFYNGEQGESSRIVNYLCYPAILLVVGLAAAILL